jgi:Ni,Fe-hydrogenase III small subunit
MAVGRIKFPDGRAARETAKIMKDAGLDPKAVREVGRAADRPGLLAELGDDELTPMRVIVGDCPPRSRVAIVAAIDAAEASAVRDAVRPRGAALISRMRREA